MVAFLGRQERMGWYNVPSLAEPYGGADMSEGTRDIIANIDRLYSLMDRDGLSAVVVRSGKNFTYLAGFAFPGTLARHLEFPDSPRGVLLVWPREGDPVMILNSFAAPLAQRDSWIDRSEVYEDYAESPYSKTADVLKSIGLHDGRLGFEKSYLNAADWEAVQGLLPRAKIVDCTQMMDEVRWIKTSGEVELITNAADILDEAYLEVFSTVRAGDTEREVHARIVRSCIQRGAQWSHGILNSDRNSVAYGGESDMVLRAGDIIRNDYVSYYRGYPGHQSRSVVIGPPSQEQRRIYGLVLDIYRSTIEHCRPGVKASSVYRFADDAFQQAGYKRHVSLAGHGVGAWWHQQPPYLVPTCDTELEAGMVIALEPHVDYYHLQDMVLVTDDGPKLLSVRFSTDEMLSVG